MFWLGLLMAFQTWFKTETLQVQFYTPDLQKYYFLL